MMNIFMFAHQSSHPSNIIAVYCVSEDISEREKLQAKVRAFISDMNGFNDTNGSFQTS